MGGQPLARRLSAIPGLLYPAWVVLCDSLFCFFILRITTHLYKYILLLYFVDHSFLIAASLRDMTSVDTDLSRTPSIPKRPPHGDRTPPLRGDNSEGSGERIHIIAEPSYFDEPPIE